MEEIRRELTTMKTCNHPNAINYNVAFIVKTELWLVMNLLGGGSCLSMLRSVAPQGIRDMDILAYILRETLLVLKHFHENQLLHRDLKAGNILLGDKDARIVLADFGVAASLKEAKIRMTFVGTPCWMAPEVLEQACGYDWGADIWSLGVTAIELATGEAPYQRLPPLKVMILVLKSEPTRLDIAHGWDPDFASLVNSCLVKDARSRPSAAALLESHARFFARADKGRTKLLQVLQTLPALRERAAQMALQIQQQQQQQQMLQQQEQQLQQQQLQQIQQHQMMQQQGDGNKGKNGGWEWNFDEEDDAPNGKSSNKPNNTHQKFLVNGGRAGGMLEQKTSDDDPLAGLDETDL